MTPRDPIQRGSEVSPGFSGSEDAIEDPFTELTMPGVDTVSSELSRSSSDSSVSTGRTPSDPDAVDDVDAELEEESSAFKDWDDDSLINLVIILLALIGIGLAMSGVGVGPILMIIGGASTVALVVTLSNSSAAREAMKELFPMIGGASVVPLAAAAFLCTINPVAGIALGVIGVTAVAMVAALAAKQGEDTLHQVMGTTEERQRPRSPDGRGDSVEGHRDLGQLRRHLERRVREDDRRTDSVRRDSVRSSRLAAGDATS